MLDEKYINALNGFKAQGRGQGNNANFFKDCEAEAQHIYRVISAHNITVEDLDENKLETYLNQEREAGELYPNPDHDGLQYVDLDQDVNIYPYTKNGHPIEDQSYCLSSSEAKTMLTQLYMMGRLNLITDTIQSLSQRADGTLLQTAFPSLHDVKACIQNGLMLPDVLLEKLRHWESLSTTEINFDFVEQVHQP